MLRSLRDALDARPDTRQRQLLVSGDGSYTNRTVLRQLPERTTFIGRIRKDAKLFLTLPPLTCYPAGETAPAHRGTTGEWADLMYRPDKHGRRRVVRMVYQVATFGRLAEGAARSCSPCVCAA